MRTATAAAFALLAAIGARADEVSIVQAEARPQGPGLWRFDVTLRHADEGWDHYADAWEVRAEDGTVLGTRELLHPHVNEQPFTRSLSGVAVPEGVERVVIHARDTVHGWSAATFAVELPR